MPAPVLQAVDVPPEAQAEAKRQHLSDRTRTNVSLAFPVAPADGGAEIRSGLQLYATLPVCTSGLMFMVQVGGAQQHRRQFLLGVPAPQPLGFGDYLVMLPSRGMWGLWHCDVPDCARGSWSLIAAALLVPCRHAFQSCSKCIHEVMVVVTCSAAPHARLCAGGRPTLCWLPAGRA